jgi:ATP-dependent helicase/nuclease subunit B
VSNLISRLAAVCRDHLLREKILVVPSLAIGHQIADAVAHGGTPWVNLRVETVRTIADAVAGFALAKEGITVLSRAQALALIERACDRVLDASSYFGALADRPGLHRAIQKSIDDLRHANVPITPSAFEDPRKATDIANILAAYEEEMAKQLYVDRFGVLARAIAMLEAGAPRPGAKDAIWIAVEDVELTAAEERLLTLVAGKFEKWSAVPRSGITGAPAVDFRRAVGEENELRGAFRSILDSNTPFDSAEIVYTTRDPYLPLAYELSSEYEIPCTFAEGIAAHFTRPGQAALAFLQWIGEGFHAVDLQRAARAGAFATPGFARILRRARIGWGRDRYLKRIDLLLADEELSDRTREAAQAAREIVVELLAMTEGTSFARATATFVARFAHVRNEVDAMAKEALRRMLDELDSVSATEDASRLAEAVRNLHVSASNPRPGFLHVAPMRAGGWAARSRMFIVGLDESKHPGSGLQDPIILDIEREAIGIPIVGDRPERSTEQFHRLLGRASDRHITLSYASLALEDRRERFPSSSLLEMFRSSTNNPNATYEEVGRSIAREGFIPIVSFSPPRGEKVAEGRMRGFPLTGSDWWLGQHFSGAPVSSPALSYPNLAAGARAENARDSEEITKWDGLITAPAAELDPRLNGRIYSASQIEKMAGCPYRHFLERILGIHPLDEIAYEEDTWLEAHEFGSLLHEVLQSTMDELCAAGRKPSMDFLPRMQAITEEALAQWRDEVPPPSEAAFEKRRKDLLDSAEIFLRTEEEACRTVTPRYFETLFGDPDPFILPLGHLASIRLRGRIDRIDHDETKDEWHVWDYKSGGTYQFDRGGVLACGTKIQHAIYARAAAAMLKGRVTRSGYLFPTTKGGGARLARECTDQELKDALNSLFDVVSRGFFPHGTEDTCRFCDFQSVCGPAADRMAKKLTRNAGDPAVKAWLHLQDIK